MPFTKEQREEIRSVLSEVHREIQAARGLFKVKIGVGTYELPVSGYDWHTIPGMDGLELKAIPPHEWPPDTPAHTDYFYSRGLQGAQQRRLSLTSRVRMEVIEGSLVYWKESQPEHKLYEAGQVFEVDPNEVYGFFARESFLNRVSFTPNIMTYEL